VTVQDTKGLYYFHVMSFYISLLMVLILMLLLLLSYHLSTHRQGSLRLLLLTRRRLDSMVPFLFNLLQCSILDQSCDYKRMKPVNTIVIQFLSCVGAANMSILLLLLF
jgi:hypothetical protein